MTLVNGVRLHVESLGQGEPVVLVHGSWGDHASWDPLVAELAAGFRAIRYDRRGHSRSERPAGQGSVHEDVGDLAVVIEEVAGEPVHLVGNSFGAAIALRLAGARPELLRSLAVHEPALLDLAPEHPAVVSMREAVAPVADLLAAGDLEGGARLFAEVVLGAWAWEAMPEALKRVMVSNATTFLDEERDPDAYGLDIAPLAGVAAPALLTEGEHGSAAFRVGLDLVAAALPDARRRLLPGAGHVPYATHPAEYAAALTSFWTGGGYSAAIETPGRARS